MFVTNNTLQSSVDYMKKELAQLFSDNALKQIVYLTFSKLFNFSKTDIILKKENGLSESDLLKIRDVVKRLQQNEPIQYILGETLFCDLLLKTDKRALIPRPETEELVHYAVKNNKNAPRWLDLCTGSGCIALAVKNQLESAEMTGVDASQNAIDLANENKNKLQIDVDFCVFDIFSSEFEVYLKNQKKWDVWLSNPPYIPYSDKAQMHKNVLDFEPHEALFVNNDSPIIFYERIVYLANHFLNPAGKLLVEIHESLAENVVALFQNYQFINIQIIKDLQGKNRMIYAENH